MSLTLTGRSPGDLVCRTLQSVVRSYLGGGGRTELGSSKNLSTSGKKGGKKERRRP